MAKKKKKDEEKDIIEVPPYIRQAYRHKFANFLIEQNEGTSHLHELNKLIEPYVSRERLEEELGDEYRKMIKFYMKYLREDAGTYITIQNLYKAYAEASGKQKRKDLKKEIEEESRKLVPIQMCVLLVFSAYVKVTELRRIHIPSQYMKSSTESSGSVSLDGRYGV